MQIFINEKLSSYFSLLFKKARDMRRKRIIQFAWVKDGKVFIRINENSKTIRVLHENNLNINNVN